MTDTTRPPPRTPPDGDGRSTRLAMIALGVIVAALLIALIVAVNDDDSDVSTSEPTTSTTSSTEPASDTTSSPTTAAPSTTTVPGTTDPKGDVSDVEAASIVWPAPAGDTEYDEPVELVAAFAEQVLGFSEPVVGDYQEGDSRSGEVEVRAADSGPTTTVAVRRMSDDRLYVLFAATSEVELLSPTAGSAIDHPLEVEGWGRSPEGQVRVAVLDRSTAEELGSDVFDMTESGDRGTFAGEVAWENPGGGWGAVVAAVLGDDGTTQAAAALPVGFIGGD